MIRTVDIAWLAGLLEGEGSFRMSGRSIAISVSMTDRDVIDRAATLMRGRVFALRAHLPHYKPPWRAQVKGPRAAGWMMTIYELLGMRRRQQVGHALAGWPALPYVRIPPVVEHRIIDAWQAGDHNKSALARRFGVSRPTVYAVVTSSDRESLRVRDSDHHAVTDIDIAWLAGLVEGEGNISLNGRSITIRIKMADRDVIVRAADLLGGRVLPTKTPPGRRSMWLIQVKGETAAAWAMTLYTWLGIRRRKQVRDALAEWKRQLNGVIGRSVVEAIVAYREAGLCQADIMALLKVSKSTVYRHTLHRVRRMRVTRRRLCTPDPRISGIPERTPLISVGPPLSPCR